MATPPAVLLFRAILSSAAASSVFNHPGYENRGQIMQGDHFLVTVFMYSHGNSP
jgi:hypothetical protein